MAIGLSKTVKTAKLAAPFVKGLRQFGKEIGKNSNWILPLLGMIGLGGAAWQMVDATVKAVKLCEEKQVHGTKEVIRTVWKLYIPGVGFVILTTLAIVGQGHMNKVLSRKLVTATGLYAASQADMKAFKEKAKEMFGAEEVKKVDEQVATEQLQKLPIPDEKDIVNTGHGDQLFKFKWTGAYFRACPEWIELIFKQLNDEQDSSEDGVVYMHRLIELMGLPECDAGNMYWDKYEMLQNGYKKIEADITSCRWDNYRGKQEVVSEVGVTPWPTGY